MQKDKIDTSKRVIITNMFNGIVSMNVCAVADATDEEILQLCNTENPSGTSGGWQTVVRKAEDSSYGKSAAPVQCEEFPNRLHFVVHC